MFNGVRKKKKKETFKTFRNLEKSRKLVKFKTIKTTLKSVLLKHSEVQPIITNLVFEMNDLVIHTYQFIRLYILYCFHNHLEFPIFDDKFTFVKYCIKTLGTKSNSGRKSKDTQLLDTLQEFYKKEYQPLLNHKKISLVNKSHLIDIVAEQIQVCISTNIQEHFIQHFLRFINKTTNEITEDKKELFEFKHKLLMLEDTNEIFNKWKLTHLQHILPTNINKSIYYDVKVRQFEYLKGLLYMNSVLENQGNKLFQPLPLRNNIIPKNIKFDSACIAELFCPEGEKKSEVLKKITNYQHMLWSSLLNMKHRLFKNKYYTFHNEITTDGISCSLLFIRKDCKGEENKNKQVNSEDFEYISIEELDTQQLENLKTRNIVGLDPGKHSLVYMMDGQGNKLQYTAPQRKKESMAKRNQIILQREKKINKINYYENVLSLQNSKSINYNSFKSYLVEKDRLNIQTIEFYKKEVWRKMKFRQYSYGNKSIDTFLNNIEKTFGENILICYGNWSRSSQMKHFMSTMNKGLRKLIHKRYDTITINECNTSKKCCDCFQDLKHYRNKENKEEFRLLVCSNCVSCENKKIVFRTRDANSSINIMNLGKCWIYKQQRPSEFCISSFTISNKKEEMEKVRPSVDFTEGNAFSHRNLG
jgi:hypothetical protein